MHQGTPALGRLSLRGFWAKVHEVPGAWGWGAVGREWQGRPGWARGQAHVLSGSKIPRKQGEGDRDRTVSQWQ